MTKGLFETAINEFDCPICLANKKQNCVGTNNELDQPCWGRCIKALEHYGFDAFQTSWLNVDNAMVILKQNADL